MMKRLALPTLCHTDGIIPALECLMQCGGSSNCTAKERLVVLVNLSERDKDLNTVLQNVIVMVIGVD